MISNKCRKKRIKQKSVALNDDCKTFGINQKILKLNKAQRNKRKSKMFLNRSLYKVDKEVQPSSIQNSIYQFQIESSNMNNDITNLTLNKEKPINGAKTQLQTPKINHKALVKSSSRLTKANTKEFNSVFKAHGKSINNISLSDICHPFANFQTPCNKEKKSTNSQFKVNIDVVSNSIKSIKTKQFKFETPQANLVTPKMLDIEKQDRSCEAYSTISSNEFKEVIESSIHQAALRSKKAKELVKGSKDKYAIFENDMLNQNLQLSFLPFIDKSGIQLDIANKMVIHNKILGNQDRISKLNSKSVRQKSIYERNRNASMMNARRSYIIPNGSSLAKNNDRSYEKSPKFKDQKEYEPFLPKPIKDPRYLKIKAEFKKMLIQSKIDRNSELQKPFFGDSALFLEDTPNILFNSLSPVYKPKSNCLKKLKKRSNYKSKLVFKKTKINDLKVNQHHELNINPFKSQ